MSPAEYATVVAVIEATWPNAWRPDGLPAATVAAWEPLLADLDGPLAVAAVRDLAADGREWPPPPGLVRQRCLELAGVVADVDAGRALAEVHDAIGRVGRYGTPVWSDPSIGAAVDAMGGWQACCDSGSPDVWRAHFLRVFEPLAAAARRRAALPPSVRSAVEEAGVGVELDADGDGSQVRALSSAPSLNDRRG